MDIKPLALLDDEKQVLINLLIERKKYLADLQTKIPSFELRILEESYDRIANKIQKSLLVSSVPSNSNTLKRIENQTPIFDSNGERIRPTTPLPPNTSEVKTLSTPPPEEVHDPPEVIRRNIKEYILDNMDWCRMKEIDEHFEGKYPRHVIKYHVEILVDDGTLLCRKTGKFLEFKRQNLKIT